MAEDGKAEMRRLMFSEKTERWWKMGKIDLYFDSVAWAPTTGEEILREYF